MRLPCVVEGTWVLNGRGSKTLRSQDLVSPEQPEESCESVILYVELSEGSVEMEAFTSYKGVPKRVPKPALQLLADRWSWLPLETPCREMR